jgi:hypothetical protein
LQSQQDLTLAELDDLNTVKDDAKKNRFAKRPRSPDRSMWETAAVFDDKDKNEIEKMFERFGIKADDETDDVESAVAENAEESSQTQNMFESPSHAYNEGSKLLEHVNDNMYEQQNLAFEQDESVYCRKSLSCDANTIKSEMFGGAVDIVVIDDNVFGVVRPKETAKSPEKDKKKKHDKEKKGHKGKGKPSQSKEKVRKDSVDTATSTTVQYVSSVSASKSVTKKVTSSGQDRSYAPSLGSVSPVFVADAGESTTDDLPSVHGSCLTNIVIADPGESSTDVPSSFESGSTAIGSLGLSVSDTVSSTVADVSTIITKSFICNVLLYQCF